MNIYNRQSLSHMFVYLISLGERNYQPLFITE